MSPRTKMFKSNSIIYFEKDKAETIFLLKEGKVNLVYDDVQLGDKVIDAISAGEFFGVKSGLIKYPREETAKVVQDSVIYEFSIQEFEALLMKNTKVVLKMLKAFSNQLRKVGKQVQSMVSNKVSSDPSDEFFLIGEYYLKNKRYKQAITVYQRYKHYYPDGRYSLLAAKRLDLAKNALDSYGEGGGPAPILDKDSSIIAKSDNSDVDIDNKLGDDSSNDNIDFSQDFDISSKMEENKNDSTSTGSTPTPANENSEGGKHYYKGISFMSQKKYIDAFNTFKKVLQVGNEEEKIMAGIEIGKCFFFLQKYRECINHFKNLLSKHPEINEKNEILFYMGSSYKSLGDESKAEDSFQEIIENTSEQDKIHRMAQNALKEM